MIFHETKLKGAFIIEPEKLEDERGFLAREYCDREFKSHEIDIKIVQCSLSFNKKKHTLRGMHYQAEPFQEDKLVRCTKGAVYDVIIDLRSYSPTYLQWVPVELTARNQKMIYIPKDFAHGFMTLEDETEIFYQMSEFHIPEYARGIRWNDPVCSIKWPHDVAVISERDKNHPDVIDLPHLPLFTAATLT